MAINHFVRATALLGYREYMLSEGADPDFLLARYNIDVSRIGQDNYLVKYKDFIELLTASAVATNDPMFGLHFSQAQPIDFLGPIAAVARSSDTVLTALAEIAKYIHHFSPAANMSVKLRNETVHIVLDVNVPGNMERRQLNELKLGLTVNVINYLADCKVRPSQVSLPHSYQGRIREYEDFFNCPVAEMQGLNAISFNLHDLESHIKSADRFLHDLAAERVGQEVALSGVSLIDQVLNLSMRLLPTAKCTLEAVASMLFLHERTLQRHLKAHNTTFKTLLDKARQQRAAVYLDMEAMPLSQISAMLGFQEQSSFNKACQRWWKQSPKQVRASRITKRH